MPAVNNQQQSHTRKYEVDQVSATLLHNGRANSGLTKVVNPMKSLFYNKKETRIMR